MFYKRCVECKELFSRDKVHAKYFGTYKTCSKECKEARRRLFNNFRCRNGVCEIYLYNTPVRALIDEEDLEDVSNHYWSLAKNGYIVGRVDKVRTRLHIFLMGKKNGLVIDHINHNK